MFNLKLNKAMKIIIIYLVSIIALIVFIRTDNNLIMVVSFLVSGLSAAIGSVFWENHIENNKKQTYI